MISKGSLSVRPYMFASMIITSFPLSRHNQVRTVPQWVQYSVCTLSWAITEWILENQSSSLKGSPPPLMRRQKNWALNCERYYCSILTYFPLVFVYSMTTWAIWVQVKLALEYKKTTLRGIPSRTLCLIIGY